jgi:L-malate glycosyltransferase
MPFVINTLESKTEPILAAREDSSSLKCKSLHIRAMAADPRPHILFIIDALSVMGGTEKVLLNMIRRLPKDRFRCSLVTFKIDETAIPIPDIGCPLHVLPLKKTYDFNALRVARRLRDLIRRERVTIVHTFFETSDLWAAPLAKLARCPVLISSRRDLGFSRSLKHSLGYKFLRDIYDLVLAVSPQVRDFCVEHDGVRPVKVRVLANGVDLDAIDRLPCREKTRRQMEIAEHVPVITTVANIRRIKGLDLLVEAARMVCDRHPDALFVIAGTALEQAYFEALQTRIAALHLQANFRLLGPRPDVFALLGASDLFCLPSRSEGLSNSLIEAMAVGLPCVATDVGGNRELVEEGATGFLVASEDWPALAERLNSLLDDPELGRGMGERARASVRSRFDIQRMIDELASVYDDLLATRGYATCPARS